MFPLGSAILPGTILPLHIFEPRYVQLLLDVRASDDLFGTTLITRGREAGSDVDQQRADVGTVIRVVQSERMQDGGLRFAVLGIAEARLEVRQWLPDNPYPLAEVEILDEPMAGPEHQPAFGDALTLLADVLNLREELGEQFSDRIDQISDDPALAAFQMAAAGGVTPLDAFALLTARDVGERLGRVKSSLRDTMDALQFRLGE